MIKELQLRILPEEAVNEQALKRVAARETGMKQDRIEAVRVLKRSIDARQRTIYVNVKVRIFIDEVPTELEYQPITYGDVSDRPTVVVVGAGPGGLFAALRLIELGFRPLVIERGKNVRDRKRDIAAISREQVVNSESNYSFGEGGAGAYSDGKLYTRSKKRGSVDRILNIFCQHGASPTILSDAHPHIGTDKLPRVIEQMREQILKSGGEVHFETRMEALIRQGDRVVGVETNRGLAFQGPVILATGHSARDLYTYLYQEQIPIEAKGIAVGVRLEHPSALIDQIQYHRKEGRGKYLPAAEYSFVTQVQGRGVYSFCMCPGGHIVPSATAPQQIVVNGMSASHRNSPFANSGIVVELRPDDLTEYAHYGELCGLHFQMDLEHLAYTHNGGGLQTAPAQRLADFVGNRLSTTLPACSYLPGIAPSPMHEWLPERIGKRLQEGFKGFDRKMRGFLTNDAVIVGVESRSSSPVRIPRNTETLEHSQLRGLYPAGEGSGYAGGITSSAMDGERCADMIAAKMAH